MTAVPPDAGVYRYIGTVEGDDSSPPPPAIDQTVTVTAAKRQGSGWRQEHTWRVAGDTSSVRLRLLWTTEELRELARTSMWEDEHGRPREEVCTFEPPLVSLRFPVAAGLRWDSSGSCPGLTLRDRYRVVDRETVTVAGTRVATYQIERTRELVTDDETRTERRQVWYSPERGLAVQIWQEADGVTSTLRLRSLDPETA